MNGRGRKFLVFAAILLLTGCESAEHDMYDQPRYKAQSPGPLFADGNSARTPPSGTVVAASGAEAGASSGRRGRAALLTDTGGAVAGFDEPPLTMPLLRRGRERFAIFCEPCHGRAGYGDGMVVQRGFPAPESFHDDRLRNASDAHLFDVISHGSGAMYPFADRIAPPDRWAIVAYLRALQLSQHAPRSQLEPEDLKALDVPQRGSP